MAIKKRAVGYIRVSVESEDSMSLEVQEEAIKEYVDYKKHRYINTYKDRISGYTTKDRPGLMELLEDVRAGKVDIVVVWRLDRFGRSSIELQQNYEKLQKHGVDLVSVGQDMDFSTPHGTFYLQMLAAVAEMERQMIKERMYGGRIRKAKSGIPTTKKFSFGRTFNYKTEEWEMDEDKKEAIEWVANQYLNNDKSLRELASKLNKDRNIKLGEDGLRNILKNHCSTKWYQHFKDREPNEFEIPPLLDDVTIKKITDRMAFNKRCNQTKKRKYVLTGYLRCEKCNYALSGADSNGRRVYQHSNKVDGIQKFCMSIRADMIEDAVFETLLMYFGDHSKIEEATKENLKPVEKRKELVKEINLKEKAAERIYNEWEQTLDKRVQEDYLPEMISKRIEGYKDTYGQLSAEIKKLKAKRNSLPSDTDLERDIEQLKQDIAKKFSGPNWLEEMTFEDKRKLLHWLFQGKDEDGKPYGIYFTKEGKYKNADIEYSIHAKISEGLGGWFLDGEHEMNLYPSYKGTLDSKDNKTNGSDLQLVI
jgi:site-specific DNA recombinase